MARLVGATRKQLLTTDEKLAHVEEWQRSGVSKTEHARRHGINIATFQQWTRGKKLRDTRKTEDAARAIDLIAAGSSVEDAAEEVGMGLSTLYLWLRRGKAFAQSPDSALPCSVGNRAQRVLALFEKLQKRNAG